MGVADHVTLLFHQQQQVIQKIKWRNLPIMHSNHYLYVAKMQLFIKFGRKVDIFLVHIL